MPCCSRDGGPSGWYFRFHWLCITYRSSTCSDVGLLPRAAPSCHGNSLCSCCPTWAQVPDLHSASPESHCETQDKLPTIWNSDLQDCYGKFSSWWSYGILRSGCDVQSLKWCHCLVPVTGLRLKPLYLSELFYIKNLLTSLCAEVRIVLGWEERFWLMYRKSMSASQEATCTEQLVVSYFGFESQTYNSVIWRC